MANALNKFKAYILSNGYLTKYNINAQEEKYTANIVYPDNSLFNIDCYLTNYNNKNGLIFINDEPFNLILHLRKLDYIDETCTMQYSIFNTKGTNIYTSLTKSISFPNRYKTSIELWELIDLPIYYGVFTMQVKITNQSGKTKEFTFPFSRIYRQFPSNIDKCWTNVNIHFTSGSGDVATKLELAKQAGFTSWRATMPWQSIEKNGQWVWPETLMTAMEKTKELGMRALIILGYGNDDYGEVNPNNEIWLNGYINYCRAVAEKLYEDGYGDCVDFEVWNEWNHASVGKVPVDYRDGRNYAKVVNSAYHTIKEILPNAKIIGGAVAGDPEEWIREMFEYYDDYGRTLDLIDAFSFHTYPLDKDNNFISPEQYNYISVINHIKDLLEEFDCADKEIWLTETGWSTNKAGANFVQGVSEETAAAYMTRFYIQNEVSGIKKVFWYDFMDDGINITNREHNFGLIHNWNPIAKKVPYAAKRGYTAMSTLNSVLGSAVYTEEITHLQGVYAHAFRKSQGTERLLIVWTDENSKKLGLTCTGDFVSYNMYGNMTNYTKNKTYEITLSSIPMYIQYKASDRLTPTIIK